jgi:hypothetical protein
MGGKSQSHASRALILNQVRNGSWRRKYLAIASARPRSRSFDSDDPYQDAFLIVGLDDKLHAFAFSGIDYRLRHVLQLVAT